MTGLILPALVAVISPIALQRLEIVKRTLATAGCTVQPASGISPQSGLQQISSAIGHAEYVLAGNERYSEEVLARAPGLRMIARCGVGYDAIDLASATRGGVLVTATPGANTDSVAEHTIALMLACLRRIPELDRRVRRGTWRPESTLEDLGGKTVGILGMGAVGSAVAVRLEAFGVRILAHDPAPQSEPNSAAPVELVSLSTLVRHVDILTLHAPLNAQTENLIDEEHIAQLRPGAIIINTSRGGLIDEAALVKALGKGHIACAGLDVFDVEPVASGSDLARLPNTILTPHAAAYSDQSVSRTVREACEAVVTAARGEMPHSAINPEAW